MKKITSALLLCMAIQFSFSQAINLNLKVFIEGPYYNGQMTPFLNVLGYLPVNQPYNIDPWNYNGTESVGSVPNANIVDWVLVDVLKPHSNGNQIRFEVMGRKAGFLFKDGYIKDIDGTSNLTVETKMTSGFYIRIHHRNHLSVISAVPLIESAGVFSYDFTLSADQALGGFLRQKQLSTLIWGMIAADANASGQIDNRDKNEVWLLQQGLTGYFVGDFNLDTQVDADDKVVKWEPNAGKSSYPVKDTILPLFICGSSSVMLNGLVYGTVKFNDQCWLDRNLGANQVATAYNDPLSYGELFQWGRLIDGHQIRTSSTTNTLSPSDVPGHGDFIITEDDPYDWRSPQNNNLWQQATNINNPCPDGWNIPSLAQWQDATVGWSNRTDAFNSILKLPSAGWRNESVGNISNAGSWGNYWTTSVNSTGARGIYFDSFNFNSNTYARASGRSVRCLKTDYVPNNPPAEPSEPIPANGAIDVETNINLSWVCSDPDGDDLTYNIYFGTTEIPPLVVTNNPDTTWNPGLLNLNTTYYWKIVAYDIYGDSTQSAVWNFTTKIPFDCGDILVDSRDGQTYNTVQIGEQCWMAENLNIGTMINGNSDQTDNGAIEKYCYDNNNFNCDNYGGLYQWNEMMEYSTQVGTQGICPNGWHLPTDAEYSNLTDYLGGISIAGGKMKTTGTIENSTGLWYAPNTGATNSSGFSALPSGYLLNLGNFVQLGYYADFWSSTDSWYRELRYNFEEVHQSIYNEYSGFSVRCIKDNPATWSCGNPLLDTRDGQTYNTVQIGEQCWMAENLNIGTMINGSLDQTDNGAIEKYCYDNNTANCDTYGGMYQWNEVMQYTTQEGTIGLCPAGWHIPTDAEFFTLTDFLGGENIAGGKMKTTGAIEEGTGLWYSPNTGATNLSGFSLLPLGFRNAQGNFGNLSLSGTIWSSTEESSANAWARSFFHYDAIAYHHFGSKISGEPVRCIKNSPLPTWSCGDPLNDTRDGQTYNTVQIGEQCWMSENLNIGTMIPGTTEMTNNSIIEKYCYNDDETNCNTYGGFYQWNEMMQYTTQEGTQGVCHIGWHLPSIFEWCTLFQYVDPSVNCNIGTGYIGTDVGAKLKSTTGWYLGGNGTNSYGFDALPGGYFVNNGVYYGVLDAGAWWSSTEFYTLTSYYFNLSYNKDNLFLDQNGYKLDGSSVRCLKDTPPPTWSCGDPLNDTRDGQTYNTVQIGEQCWMAENLNVGDKIQGVYNQSNNSIIEKYCYNNSSDSCNIWGGLYQWEEAMQYIPEIGTQGICPIGWHIPSDNEWCILENYADSIIVPCDQEGFRGIYCAGNLKEVGTIHWWEPNTAATDLYGFSALAAGDRYYDVWPTYADIYAYANFWTSNEQDNLWKWYRAFTWVQGHAKRGAAEKTYGFSVRCLKN